MIFIGILLTGIGWVYGLYKFQTLITQYSKNDVTVDGIVVFTGGKGRIEKSLKLLQQNKAERLLVSGVFKDHEHLPSLTSLPPAVQQKVQLGHFAADTLTNVKETKDWVIQYHLKSILLVTSHYHMPRSYLILKNALPNIKIYLYPVINKYFNSTQWWKDPILQRIIINEYNKFVIMWLKDKIDF